MSGARVKNHFTKSIVLLIPLMILTLLVANVAIYQKINAVTSPSQSDSPGQIDNPENNEYINSRYGISFEAPPNWRTSGDSVYDPKLSATRQIFGTSVMQKDAISAVNLEVLDEPIGAAEAWYDIYYAQTSVKVNKTTERLKNKRSVQYHFVTPKYESKQYLIAVGSQTYVYSSVNEDVLSKMSESYWSDFNNIFNSLIITK